MFWYKFYIGDYLRDTVHLDDAEDLVYRRLLDMYYMGEKELPLDIKVVARKIRMDADITETILNEFFEKTETGYRNSRANDEISKYQAQVETNREIGKRGGRPKKTDSVSENNPNQNQNQIKDISSQATRFEEFWSVWPSSKRKVGKVAVQKKWKLHNLDSVADKIISHVNSLKHSEQWTTGFEPAPMTYINQRRWEDQEVKPQFGRRII